MATQYDDWIEALTRIAETFDPPQTRSGKIMRRLLRAEALGMEAGDISTMED